MYLNFIYIKIQPAEIVDNKKNKLNDKFQEEIFNYNFIVNNNLNKKAQNDVLQLFEKMFY